MKYLERLDDLLARIDELVERSCALPDSSECWEQRLYIDFELVLLFQHLAAVLQAGAGAREGRFDA